MYDLRMGSGVAMIVGAEVNQISVVCVRCRQIATVHYERRDQLRREWIAHIECHGNHRLVRWPLSASRNPLWSEIEDYCAIDKLEGVFVEIEGELGELAKFAHAVQRVMVQR